MEEHTRREALTVIVDRLERTLKAADAWESDPPAKWLLSSREPFCYDTLSFTQWLQWHMIPNMRRIFENYDELPQESAILPYAEECMPEVSRRQELLRLIERFDELISA